MNLTASLNNICVLYRSFSYSCHISTQQWFEPQSGYLLTPFCVHCDFPSSWRRRYKRGWKVGNGEELWRYVTFCLAVFTVFLSFYIPVELNNWQLNSQSMGVTISHADHVWLSVIHRTECAYPLVLRAASLFSLLESHSSILRPGMILSTESSLRCLSSERNTYI